MNILQSLVSSYGIQHETLSQYLYLCILKYLNVFCLPHFINLSDELKIITFLIFLWQCRTFIHFHFPVLVWFLVIRLSFSVRLVIWLVHLFFVSGFIFSLCQISLRYVILLFELKQKCPKAYLCVFANIHDIIWIVT